MGKSNKTKITICIPAYNSAATIRESIESALAQEYPLKEVLVVDDGSTDDTLKIAREYPVRVHYSNTNNGIGVNLALGMELARGKYVVYLCSDDLFADVHVVGDIVSIFDNSPEIGVINRYYYQFMNGYPGAVMTVRENNILLSSCNPSGMAFRAKKVWGSNKIFLEMPLIVTQYLQEYHWTTMEYDTVAVRIHPGGNTGTKAHYYTESPVQVYTDFLGKEFKYHLGLIQIKNSVPQILYKEIYLTLKINKRNLIDPFFWFCAIVALCTPRSVLRPLCNFYRHRINRRFCKIIPR